MNKQHLADTIARGFAMTNVQAVDVVNTLFLCVGDALAAGDTVRIAGFGTFQRVATAARVGRNPKTGEAVQIPAGYRVKFKAARALKE